MTDVNNRNEVTGGEVDDLAFLKPISVTPAIVVDFCARTIERHLIRLIKNAQTHCIA